jgi:Protein of unknown function (DUF3551)
MRLLLFILGISVGIAWTGNRADAQSYPWCAYYGGDGDGGGTNCGFTTFQQCQDTVSGIGGFCQRNNLYPPPPGPHQLNGVQRRYRY